MAGSQVEPGWNDLVPAIGDDDGFEALDALEEAGDWDDSSAFTTDIERSGSWRATAGSVKHPRARHARRHPSLALRACLVVLACLVTATAGLIGATFYRLHVGSQPSLAASTRSGTQHIPPVITLFSPEGSTHSQAGATAGSVSPLPVTTTAAPSQYLAPDKASDYELSLIAASGAPEKAIVVSRFSQTIHVYESGQFIAGSYAITGRPELPTPVGVYQIFLKIAPAVLYSPWPPGSPFYYPPAPVNYTMEFRAGGFLIHDAPWHHVWGPGMNDWHYDSGAKEWQWGTHGCVTAPTPFIQWLYNWSPNGTTVIIY